MINNLFYQSSLNQLRNTLILLISLCILLTLSFFFVTIIFKPLVVGTLVALIRMIVITVKTRKKIRQIYNSSQKF